MDDECLITTNRHHHHHHRSTSTAKLVPPTVRGSRSCLSPAATTEQDQAQDRDLQTASRPWLFHPASRIYRVTCLNRLDLRQHVVIQLRILGISTPPAACSPDCPALGPWRFVVDPSRPLPPSITDGSLELESNEWRRPSCAPFRRCLCVLGEDSARSPGRRWVLTASIVSAPVGPYKRPKNSINSELPTSAILLGVSLSDPSASAVGVEVVLVMGDFLFCFAKSSRQRRFARRVPVFSLVSIPIRAQDASASGLARYPAFPLETLLFVVLSSDHKS